MLLDDLSVTAEGRESSFVSNLLSHYQLTEGLIRAGLLAGPKATVINMTSGGGYGMPLMVAMLIVTGPARCGCGRRYGAVDAVRARLAAGRLDPVGCAGDMGVARQRNCLGLRAREWTDRRDLVVRYPVPPGHVRAI